LVVKGRRRREGPDQGRKKRERGLKARRGI
jgi:hypothetical protein